VLTRFLQVTLLLMKHDALWSKVVVNFTWGLWG